MQNTAWKYYLLDSMGRPYRIVNGVIVAANDHKPLKYTPSGWDEISLSYERDMALFGLVRNFSLPLEFVLDGADILRSVYYGRTFEERISILIQKQKLFIDGVNYYYYYDYFYKGELDGTTMKDEENKVTVSIAEGGLSKDLKANQGTNFEFPVDEVTIKMDGFPLYEIGQYSVIDGVDMRFGLSPLGLDHTLSLALTATDGRAYGISFNGQSSALPFLNQYFSSNETPITDPLTIPIRFKGTIQFTATEASGAILTLYFIPYVPPSAINLVDRVIIFTGAVNPGIYTVPFDVTVPLAQGKKLMLAMSQGGFGSGANTTIHFNDGSDFEASFSETYPTTYIKANRAITMFNRIGQKVSTDCRTVSTLLEGFNDICITSFDAIRGLTGAVIKTNMTDFFTSINAVLNVGMGVQAGEVTPGTIGQILTLEDKSYYFDASDPIPLGNIKTPVQTWFTDVIVNTVKIGYSPQEVNSITDINGKQEFNTTSEYSSPVKKITKALELISRYRADPFGIENGRLNLDGKKTTADNSDNDVCFLAIDYANPQTDATIGTYYNLKRVVYDVATGVTDPDKLFNIEYFTPARMRERHASLLNSVFYGFEGQELTFQTLTRNRDLYTKKGTAIYDEDSNYLITDSPRLFKPLVFEVTPETPRELVELLEDNPNRCFSFNDPLTGNQFTGFNYKIGIAANTLEEQAFLLISTADNDLTKLK